MKPYFLNTIRGIIIISTTCAVFAFTYKVDNGKPKKIISPISKTPLRNKKVDTLGLTHRYSFTKNANDAVGSANGTLEGNAVISKGKVILDGSQGTYVNLPAGMITGYTAVTFECWVNIGENDNYARIFDQGSIVGKSGQRDLYLCVYHTATRDWRLMIVDTKAPIAKTVGKPGSLTNKGYVYLAGVFNPATGFMGVYMNGELVDSRNDLTSLNGVDPDYFFLGRSLFASDAYLKGEFDEFRIYKTALSTAQIAANYANGPDAKLPKSVK
jgi:hypothetical protein